MSTPALDTLRHLLGRLRANDIAWFRDEESAGRLDWLRDALGEPDGAHLHDRMVAGDLDWLRHRLGRLPLFTESLLPLAAYGLRPPGALHEADGVDVEATHALPWLEGDQGRRAMPWLAPLALLIAACAFAFGVYKLNQRDDTSGSSAATAATAATAAASTEAATTAAPNTVAATTAAPTTAAATTSPATTTTEPLPVIGDLVTFLSSPAMAEDGPFRTITKLIDASGHSAALRGPGPWTLFAPSDAAFASWPVGQVDALIDPANKASLDALIAHLYAPGNWPATKIPGASIPTVDGSTLTGSTANGELLVETMTVIAADLVADNGVVQVIDGLPLPAGYTLPVVGGALAVDTTVPAAPPTTNAAGDATPENLTVYFANGSSALDAEALTKIAGAAELIHARPAGLQVKLVGHASAVGNAAANQALSEKRAQAVQAQLETDLGADAAAYGFDTSAVGSTNLDVDDAHSRRVTIEIPAA